MPMLVKAYANGNGREWFRAGIALLFLVGLFVPCAARADCKTAKLNASGTISLESKVSWRPATCKLVLQAYQRNRLVGEYGKQAGVASGTISAGQLTGGMTGRTELKIWVPGEPTPADATWVSVRADNK